MTDAPAIAGPGHNNPPEPSPFEQSQSEIDGLFTEASNWLDGSGINSATDAEAVSRLLDMIRKATATADERRKAENEPFDTGKAEVQTRYGKLIADTKSQKGRAILAAECCKKALAPWLEKLDAEKIAIAQEARRKADEATAKAQEALRASRADDLAGREAAEEQLQQAKRAEAAATRAEKDKAHAKGGTRAVTLRSNFRPEITDATAFARWLWAAHKDELVGHLMTIAERHVANGAREMPGVNVIEERKAV